MNLLLLGIILSIFSAIFVYSQLVFPHANGEEIEGENRRNNAINSKYLTITEHRYGNNTLVSFTAGSGGPVETDEITGSIMNNSTQKIWNIVVYAALYDKDNKLITLETGSNVDDSALTPGDNSTFSITLSDIGEEAYHYTLIPSGTPQQ